ncbi:MAG: hypothetical protein MUE33_01220 [Cytophagaceae bacterium]|jgi:hypothetical protein|nr:hypothetical protein [Cytophagaceae bacterium]
MFTKYILRFVLFCSLTYTALAQSPVYFTGYGRALIDDSRFSSSSPFIENDTTSAKKALRGNFMFDLGINVKPNDNFRVNTILRVNNQFGGFFSTGSDLQFRQVQIEGVLAKKVSYGIGDLDFGLTKYTLYNSFDPTYSPFEAEAIKIRRDIMHYENFNTENKWRLQGVRLGTELTAQKYIQSVRLLGFATRIIPSNFMNTPDRLLYGGNIQVVQSKYLTVGGNIAGISDIQGTVIDTVVFYQNNVVTGEYKLNYASKTYRYQLFGELGRSFYNFNKVDQQVQVKTTDGFFEAGAQLKHRYHPFQLMASYRVVGPEFYSPGAQTRRIYDDGTPGLLNDGVNGVDSRNQTIYDRMTDLNVYNRSIATTLMYFNPIYNNATPYGAATPNRKGLTLDVMYGNKDSLLYASANVQVLSEVLGVGFPSKRQFILATGGITINVNKWIQRERLFALSTGVRYEQTKGSSSADINLNSLMLDASLTYECLRNFDVIGGIKYFTASGSDIVSLRNDFNQIVDYSRFNADVRQNIWTGGVRYRFSKQMFFSANVFVTSNSDALVSSNGFTIQQYFFSYVMKF